MTLVKHNTKLKFAAALVAVALVIPTLVSAGSTPATQQNPPRGGQRQGMGQRQRPPRGPLGILNNPDVQKELGVTSDQVKQIGEALKKALDSASGQSGSGDANGGRGARPQPPKQEVIDAALKTSMSDAQVTRFHEIELQAMGGRALLRKEVAEKLKLTDEQKEKIEDLLGPQQGGPGGGEGGPPMGGPGQGGPGGGMGGPGGGGPGSGGPGQDGPGGMPGGPGAGGPPMGGPGGELGQGGPQGGPGQGGPQQGPGSAQNEKLTKKALAVLTPDQLAIWKGLTGKPFKFKRQAPPVGGGNGAPGGPGGQPPEGGPGGELETALFQIATDSTVVH